MAQQPELHVVFGTGPLGLAVIEDLVQSGKSVRAVNRGGRADVPAGVEVMAADAYALDSARRAAAGAAVVYQCAQPSYHEWVEKFPALQRNILEAAVSAGAKLVVGDNLYMYGEVNSPLTEDLPYAATTRKGRVRAQMAVELLEAHRSGRVKVAIGRGSDFFGPGVLGSTAGERMFGPAVKGKAAEGYGNVDLPHTYTYIKDFGTALAVLGGCEEAFGQAWHVPNAAAITTRRFIELIFEALGRPARINRMGPLMLRIGGLFLTEAREMIEMMYEFEKPFVVDSSKFTRAFGRTATPLKEAIAETVRWYSAQSPRRS